MATMRDSERHVNAGAPINRIEGLLEGPTEVKCPHCKRGLLHVVARTGRHQLVCHECEGSLADGPQSGDERSGATSRDSSAIV
jgi:hypothetical protein